MNLNIYNQNWLPILSKIHQEPLLTLRTEILSNCTYYPKEENILKVFETPLQKIKIVILGQEPYHIPNVDIGRAFAVNEEVEYSPSLRVIREEIAEEIKTEGLLFDPTISYDKWKTLEHLQEQGVFLLNTALTVEQGNPGSHIKYWEEFIESTLRYISIKNPCVWILLGEQAIKQKKNIMNKEDLTNYKLLNLKDFPVQTDKNYILETPHPMVEIYKGGKRRFAGSNIFMKSNLIIKKQKKEPVLW